MSLVKIEDETAPNGKNDILWNGDKMLYFTLIFKP